MYTGAVQPWYSLAESRTIIIHFEGVCCEPDFRQTE
jgi:hypothetical protein